MSKMPTKGRATEVTVVRPRTGEILRKEIWELLEIDGRQYLRVPRPFRFTQPRDETLQIVEEQEGVDAALGEPKASEHISPERRRGLEEAADTFEAMLDERLKRPGLGNGFNRGWIDALEHVVGMLRLRALIPPSSEGGSPR